MNLFFIYADSGCEEKIDKTIKEKFQYYQPLREQNTWIVASNGGSTPSIISDTLGFNENEKNTGVVVKISSYSGFYSGELWDKLREWENV